MQATLELIKSEGIEGVTIRKISALAGANVALVNYYFGSKEKLISESIKIQFDSFKEAFSALNEKELPPLARLKNFLLQYALSLQEHPELVKRLLGQDNVFESQAEYVGFIKKQGFEQLQFTLSEITGEVSRDIIFTMVQQIFAAILSPMIKAAFHEKKNADDSECFPPIVSTEKRIDFFLDHYFYKYRAH